MDLKAIKEIILETVNLSYQAKLSVILTIKHTIII